MVKVNNKLIVLICLFFIISFYFLSKIEKQKVNEDELLFIDKTRLFDLFFLNREFNHPLFLESFHHLDHPYFIGYYYGFILHLGQVKDINLILNQTNFDSFLPYWNSHGQQTNSLLTKFINYPQSEEFKTISKLVYKARVGSWFIILICFFLLFLILKKTIGFYYSLLGIFLFFINPITQNYAVCVLGDQLLLFTFLLAPMITFYLIKQISFKKLLIGFLFLSLTCTLALGVKINGAVTLIFFVLFSIIYSCLNNFSKNKKIKKMWFIFPVLVIILTLLIFIVFHPFLWKNLISGLKSFLAYRLNIVKVQSNIWPDEVLTANWFLKFNAMGQNLFYLPLKIDILPFLLGAFISIKLMIKDWVRHKFNSNSIYTFWNLVLFISFYFYIALNWQRYFWVLVPGLIFFQLQGLFFLILTIKTSFSKIKA